MARRSVLYLLLVAALLTALAFPTAGLSDRATALQPHRVVHAVAPSTTTSTVTYASPDVTIPPVVNGLAPVVTRLLTKQPVVFLGIDDGLSKQPFELQMMKDNDVHATLFLANLFIHNQPSFFVPFVSAGSVVEDHTITHPNMRNLSYGEQVKEICGEADLQQQEFGRRPILFRPPGGNYNTDTRRAAATCGMRAVVTWIAKADAGSMQYQLSTHLRPGDIVLMHFRPEFRSDMQAFLDAMHAAGLHTELLENWLPSLQNGSHWRDELSRQARDQRILAAG